MFRAPRGTSDVLPEHQRAWRRVEGLASTLATGYGYRRIDTPLFEDTGLFVRTAGESSDIVEKEMYTFQDRGGHSLTLRPEGTAPVCRAYLENGMQARPQPVRLYYLFPLFRYDRPQAGRYRQFHQFGVEAIGDGEATVDAEVIDLAWRLCREVGLGELALAINSIGDGACRPQYLKRLVEYYTPRRSGLCSDCRERLERNPLRLLDCKQPGCRAIAARAPASADHLCPACADHWSALLSYLEGLGIPHTIDHRLVRGLDYYTRTVFEIQPAGETEAQSALCGGGRYDGLVEHLGGQPTPGAGFALGIERTVAALDEAASPTAEGEEALAGVACVGEGARLQGVKLAARLREKGIGTVVLPAGRSLKGQLRHANSLALRYVLILGERELAGETVTMRHLERGEQKEIPLASAVDALGQG